MVDYTIFLSEIDFYPSYNVFPYGFLPIDIDMLSNTTDDRFIDRLRMEYYTGGIPWKRYTATTYISSKLFVSWNVFLSSFVILLLDKYLEQKSPMQCWL